MLRSELCEATDGSEGSDEGSSPEVSKGDHAWERSIVLSAGVWLAWLKPKLLDWAAITSVAEKEVSARSWRSRSRSRSSFLGEERVGVPSSEVGSELERARRDSSPSSRLWCASSASRCAETARGLEEYLLRAEEYQVT